MAMLSTTETQTEELLKKGHTEVQADAKGISKSNINATEPSQTVAEIIFWVADVGLFELNSHGGFSFLFSRGLRRPS